MNRAVKPSEHYRAVRPLNDQFWRRESCREHNCPHYLKGWITSIDPSPPHGPERIYYIEHDSHREYGKQVLESGVVEYTFPPGQACFRQHQHLTPLERSPLFVKERDDQRQMLDGDEYVTRMNEDLYILKDTITKGG